MNTASEPDAPNRVARLSAAAIRRMLRLRLVRAVLRYSAHRGPVLADAVTYRALFSVFAGLLLAFSAAALWLTRDDAAWEAVARAVDAALPGIVKTSDDTGLIDLDSIRAPAGLSIAGAISLIGLVGAALGAIGSLRTALRSIAGTEATDVVWYRMLIRNLLLALIIAGTFAGAAAITFAGEALVKGIARLLDIPAESAGVVWGVRLVSLVVVFALDAVLIASSYRMLSGVRASARALWTGAALGAVALVVLQELSGLFVGGAKSNPLLASFASLIALLLWLNLSTQVILLAGSYVTTAAEEERDPVAARHGVETLAQFTRRMAEDDVRAATARLRIAQDAVDTGDGRTARDAAAAVGTST